MRDKDLYAKILGIEAPWFVRDVDLQLQKGEVYVFLDFNPTGSLTCPECGKDAPGYDRRERRWRHLDTCQYHTIIVADVPRVECKKDGVHQIAVPWSEPGSRFTALFEALVIDWLQEASLSAVGRLLGLSWDEVDGIMGRAVRRGLERRDQVSPERIGIDETSFQKRHEYVTVVSDHDTGDVVYVADDRKQESLDGFYKSLKIEQLYAIKSVGMDMWKGYINSTRAYVPDADLKIGFDKFHVAKHLGDAVNKVRYQEHKILSSQGKTDLKKTKYLWLMNPDNMDEERWEGFEPLRNSALKTARAWAIKELAMTLWGFSTRGWAKKAWKKCLNWAMRSNLEPIKKVARMLKTHLWGILNAIALKINNAKSEGLNSKIQKIISQACGFRNRERFRNMIYFHLGGLDLYPAGVKES
jgi:transposase